MPLSKIPSDISKLIISRLPVKSVLACKCVCRSWLNVISCLISDPDFVQMHLDCHRENSTRIMLGSVVGEEDRNDTQIHSIGYDSLASLLLPVIEAENDNNDVETPEIEDDSNDVVMDYSSSSENLLSTLTGIDGYTSQMDYPFRDSGLTIRLFGSCNGILCLWFDDDDRDDQDQFFCLWNPATREYKRTCKAPQRFTYCYITLYALVYDPTVDDYKFWIAEDTSDSRSSLVHVYSSATDSWKRLRTTYMFISSQKSGVFFKGDLHWLALGKIRYSIVSLDIKNEKFKQIQPPSGCLDLLVVGVLEEHLCVLVEDENGDIHIWAMLVYGDPNSWSKRHTITNEIITRRIRCHCSLLRFMWSFRNGVILFTDWRDLVLYDPEHGSAIEQSRSYLSAENYSESLVSLNSGIYVGGRTADSSYTELEILRYRNSVLEARNAKLEACNAQLVASNAELEARTAELEARNAELEARTAKLEACNAQLVASNAELEARTAELEARTAELEARNAELEARTAELEARKLQHVEPHVNVQKEAESKKDEEEEETAVTKNGRKGKMKYQYNTRASKAVAAMSSASGESTNFEDESLTVQQRAEKEQAKLVLLPTGGTLEPSQIKEGSKTRSTSKDTYQTMTVKTLRDLLKERGLMVKGNKDELIARLSGI